MAGISDVGASEGDLFRIGILQAEDSDVDGRTGIAAQQLFSIGEWHVAGSHIVDAFDQVARGDVGFIGGRAGNGVYYRDITVPLGKNETDAGFVGITPFSYWRY